MAGDKNEEDLIRFDIPQQRADLALTLFAEQADLTLVFPYDELRNKTANPLAGDYTVQEGARILLEGTGFEPKFGERLVMNIAPVARSGSEGDGMERKGKGLLAGMAAAVFSIFGSQSATGQDTSDPRPAVLEEVIVTAQKREQSYTDVPVSVESISGQALEAAKIDNFQELVQLSPSITFSPDRGMRGAGVLIRGIGTTAFQVGVEPTVSTVVDGVVLGRTGAFLSALVDVERVEVLRGPQGTLFGKNASGGVVNIITRRPTEQVEGMLRATYTGDDQLKVEAMASGPLGDGVRGRVVAFWNDYEGHIDNRHTGEKLNGEETRGIRAKLDIDLGDRANLLLTGDYVDQQRNCCAYTVRDTGTDAGLALALQSIEVAPFSTEVLMNTPIISDSKQGGASAELNVDFDNFALTSITAWRTWELVSEQDIDQMPYTGPINGEFFFFLTNGSVPNDQATDQLTQEFRIASTGWDTVDLTAGLYYWEQDLERYFQRENAMCPPGVWDPNLNYGDPCPAGFNLFGSADFGVDTTSIAGFGQVDWRFTDAWTLSLGLRYTYDDAEWFMDRVSDGPAPALPSSFQGTGGGADGGVSGKLALQWDFSDTSMTYFSYSRGYKAQAFDIIFGTTAERADPVPEETSDAFEIGLKGEVLDNRLRYNLATFYTTYDDFQGQALNPELLQFFLTSAGKLVTQGVELDFTALPTPNLLLSGGIAYTDATYDKFVGAGCWQGQTPEEGCVNGAQDLSGGDLPNSPDWKLTLQARYDIELDGPVDMFLSGNYRWQDEYYSTADLQPELLVPSYGIADLNVGILSDEGRWSAIVYVKNLFDKQYVDQLVQVPFDDNSTILQSLPRGFERYVGGEFTYRFGGY